MMRALPDSELGSDTNRKRYGLMGALLAGMDDASAEMERLSRPASSWRRKRGAGCNGLGPFCVLEYGPTNPSDAD